MTCDGFRRVQEEEEEEDESSPSFFFLSFAVESPSKRLPCCLAREGRDAKTGRRRRRSVSSSSSFLRAGRKRRNALNFWERRDVQTRTPSSRCSGWLYTDAFGSGLPAPKRIQSATLRVESSIETELERQREREKDSSHIFSFFSWNLLFFAFSLLCLQRKRGRRCRRKEATRTWKDQQQPSG